MNDRQELQVVFTARENAELLPIDSDRLPLGPREVRGRTIASLISTGTELAVYRNEHLPAYPGYSAVFAVDEVGGEVESVETGDVAFCTGPHRSYQRLKAEDVITVPHTLAPADALFARMMGVSMSTLTTTAARPPATVVVTGLGLVGHLAAKIFTACGYRVIACDPSERRRAIAIEQGIGTVLEDAPVDDPEVVGNVSLVVECSGHEAAVLDGCRIVRKGGEVVMVGVPWVKRTDIPAHALLHAVFHRYVHLRSGWEWEVPPNPTDFRQNSIYGNLAAAIDWIASRRIRVDGLATPVSPRAAQEAYRSLLENRTDRLGVIFDWQRLGD